MTPDERQLISGVFERMRGVGPIEKDRDADALIRQGVQQMPDAPYLLVQSVLVQEQALQQADARIQDLEARVAELEAGARPAPAPSGGFLGGMFGGGARPATAAGSSSAASSGVPSIGRQSPGFGTPQPRAGGAWGQMGGQAGAMAPGATPPGAAPAAGGGFMRQAFATAAGVAGGMLLADSIRGMMGGDAAKASPQTAANESAPASEAAPATETAQYQNPADNDPGTYDPGVQDVSFDDGGGFDGGGFDI